MRTEVIVHKRISTGIYKAICGAKPFNKIKTSHRWQGVNCEKCDEIDMDKRLRKARK